MQLLVAIISREDLLDEILSGFVDLGITGATIIRAEGMRSVLTSEVPIFAGLQSLLSRTRPTNHTLFSVIRDDAKVDAAIAMLDRVCGGLEGRGNGIVFTLPVGRAVGIEREPDPVNP